MRARSTESLGSVDANYYTEDGFFKKGLTIGGFPRGPVVKL